MPGWRNWYPRSLEVAVVARPWRFKSSPGHCFVTTMQCVTRIRLRPVLCLSTPNPIPAIGGVLCCSYMKQSTLYRVFASAVVALSLFAVVGFGGASVAQASSLTSAQVSAIVSLLQSFGADQNTINNVSAALGGSSTNTGLSCSSFSDVSYGNFDNNPGGRVSQLQTWLGISPTTFGFGTYGKKTQALWNAQCGGVVVTPPAVTNPTQTYVQTNPVVINSFTVSPTSVSLGQPITFSWSSNLTQDDISQNGGGCYISSPSFGGGMTLNTANNSTNYGPSGSFTYTPTGTAAYMLACYSGGKDGAPSASQKVIVSAYGSNGQTPTATIDPSSLTATTGGKDATLVTITGSASNTNQIAVVIKGQPSVFANVVGGRWSATVPNVYPNTYTVQVVDENTLGTKEQTLMTGTLTVTGGSTSATPSATIDQRSLYASAINTPFTISGTASGVQSVRISIGLNGKNYFYSSAYPVANGAWSVPVSAGLDAGTYNIVLLGYSDLAGSVSVTGVGVGEGGIISGGYVVVPNTNRKSTISLGVCPANAVAQRGQNGQQFSCTCPANFTLGTVWGSTYYTDSSDICTAGAQASQLNQTSGGLLYYTIGAGQGSYAGSTQNGITSQALGSWLGSFQISGPKG